MSLVQHYINNGVNINKRERKKITELCIFVDGFVITLTIEWHFYFHKYKQPF